ncbi:hypothetical protein HNQ51_000894 [Inhella inkyongensis]|uniref:Uncharacterized protein n=1 Tax=Inhella inkyongensis TaxID=392593 RepID=A0A840S4P8_9BURK|nr:hypothetical protein [Inhella inkyongensis]MBB5203601.1 hypothetical protein [Inhella inkyongensis]
MRGFDLMIESDFSLSETARRISSVLGVELVEELTGRYEEYPAFVAERFGRSYALLGPPDPEHDIRDEPTDDFCLSVVPLTGFSEKASDAGELLVALRAGGLRVKIAQ